MNKEEYSQKMDEIIILLAHRSGSAADNLELHRLQNEYADNFSGPYQFSAERMRTLQPNAQRYVKKVEAILNGLIMLKRNKPLKKQHSKKIDAFINECAFKKQCNDAELWRLATEHTQFRSPYKWSLGAFGDIEPDEREPIKRMEARVNEIIAQTIQRERPMGAMGRCVMERFSMQPLPNPGAIMQACKCTGSTQMCKLPPALCKTATHSLSRTVPRASPSPKAASPKTKAASPKTKAASPKTKAASPKTRKSNGGKRKSNSSSRKRKSSY